MPVEAALDREFDDAIWSVRVIRIFRPLTPTLDP
jgi:hypothetical protein